MFKHSSTRALTLAFSILGAISAQPSPQIFSAVGTNADNIRGAVEEYRAALGPLNAPGQTGDAAGRREINWDGVPAQFSAPNAFPNDFFNKNSARGAVLSASGAGWTSFEVSANQADGPIRFDNIVPGYSSLFPVFSEQKLFASLGSHIYDVDFFVPGTETKAVVKGFGAIFSNVAIPFRTTIEYYSPEGVLLGKYSARVSPKGLSFLGVQFPSAMVGKVRIALGTAAPGVADDPANGVNIVAADDFIYGEPVNSCVSR